MAGTDPRDRATHGGDATRGVDATPGEARPRRELERAPSARYAPARHAGEDGAAAADRPTASALMGPLARALLVSVAGAGALVLVGAILASTVGLLFISGAIGASVGLLLARAAVPAGGARPVTRRTVTLLALALTIGAIAVAGAATWLYARSEGGTLDLVDYLLTTFGPFVPGELVIGSVAAAWGANAGPVQR